MRYLDIDLILSEEERLPCEFIIDAAYIGFLNPNESDDSDVLKASTSVELPMWLALALSERNVVNMHMVHVNPFMNALLTYAILYGTV